MKSENPNSKKPGNVRQPGSGRPKGSRDTKKRKAKKAKPKKPGKPKETPGVSAPEVKPYPRVGDDVKKYGPRNVEFEDHLEILDRELRSEKPKPAKPAKPAMQDQAGLEVKIIANFLKLPFATWASRIDFPAIRLTENEAKEWAEPTKVLLDHYLPIIPPIAYAWFAWSITTISIVNTRLELIAAVKRKRGESQTESKAGPVEAPRQGAPTHKPAKV